MENRSRSEQVGCFGRRTRVAKAPAARVAKKRESHVQHMSIVQIPSGLSNYYIQFTKLLQIDLYQSRLLLHSIYVLHATGCLWHLAVRSSFQHRERCQFQSTDNNTRVIWTERNNKLRRRQCSIRTAGRDGNICVYFQVRRMSV